MKTALKLLIPIIALSAFGCKKPNVESSEASHVRKGTPEANSGIWVIGYYRASQDSKLPPEKVNYGAITHLLHFSLEPTETGELKSSEGLTPAKSKAAVAAAHKAGRKAIITVGGWATEKGFRLSVQNGHMDKLIGNIINYAKTHSYDGIDIDWEILRKTDHEPFVKFIKALRARMKKEVPHMVLAAATQWEYQILAAVKNELDHINLMTYDLNGAWDGGKVSHHSAPFGAKSVQSEVQKALKVGIPASKLGIGVAFYGYKWKGNTKIGEPWSAAAAESTKKGMPTISYNTLMDTFVPANKAFAKILWDNGVSAPYMVVDKPGTDDDVLISFENEYSIKSKFDLIRGQKLGGVIIWSIDKDLLKDGRTPLMDAIKKHAFKK